MVIPHSGGYPRAQFEGYLLLFKFGPRTKSGLTIPQCGRGPNGGGEMTAARLQQGRMGGREDGRVQVGYKVGMLLTPR